MALEKNTILQYLYSILQQFYKYFYSISRTILRYGSKDHSLLQVPPSFFFLKDVLELHVWRELQK